MKSRKSKSYFVRYVTWGREDCLVVLPNFTRLALWFLREARRCESIQIYMD